jgi:tetratricopeptide (TPR) repeat protein
MKRVLDQTPPWAVIPVSVLGASLLLGLAHYVLDSGTPPVAKHPSAAALGDPSPQLLPHKEWKAAGSAKASDVLTTREGAESRHCLASSDAVSVLPPIDTSGRGNTGWHPMNSTGATPARPVALVATDGYPSQARMVEPSPRYGANVSEWDEMPLIAPIEEVHEPVESSPHGLINSLFLPPAVSTSQVQTDPSTSVASSSTVVEDTWEGLSTLPEPVPAVETSDVHPAAPSRETAEPVLPLPPVESSLPKWDEVVAVESFEGPAESIQEPTSGGLLPLPPVELSQDAPLELPPTEALEDHRESAPGTMEDVLTLLPPVELVRAAPFEPPPTEALEAPRESAPDGTDDVLVPLPPVESELVETGVDEGEPMLTPLPPVEPRLLVPGEPLAIAMVEGLFERVDQEPDANPELKPAMDRNGDNEAAGDPQDVLEGKGALAGVGEEEEAPQPLPPVVRGNGGQAAKASAAVGAAFSARQHERSWELELIAREADKHSRRAFELANKKANFSARLEFTRALRIISQGLDTERGTSRHSRALAAGLRALVEAEDFLPKDGHLEAELDLAVISGAHRTPILRECDANAMTPLSAIQKYHTFAQEKMAEAVGREVAGSMALCGLGKLHIAISNQRRGDGIASARSKAMVLLQAALIASPANHMASNELGVLLARNSRYAEARRAFEHSVAAHPSAEAWRNLALTCEQLGEMDQAYRAAQQTLALRGNSKDKIRATASSRGAIRWVSPAELSRSGGTLRTASASGASDRAR